MNAKAKVVAYYSPITNHVVRNQPNSVYIPLVPEAALAELVAERDAWQRLAGEWQQATERRKEENTTLLTGLEALAGEIVAQHEGYDDQAAISARVIAEKFRTLSSSATGGKNTKEERK